MALQVWLPLNGDLKNKGCADVTVTNNGATVDNNGKIGKCYEFGNGSASSKGIAINDNFLDIGTSRSICAWVYPKGNHYHYSGTIASSGNWNAKRWAFCLKRDNTGFTGFDNLYNSYYTTPIPVNTWTHLCVTVEGNVTKFYKNGVYLGQLTRGTTFQSDASSTYIGRETYLDGYFTFNGCINDVRIYNHCLSPKEVKEISQGLILHYKSDDLSYGYVVDSSGYGNNGTYTNASAPILDSDTPRYNNCIKFDTTSKYVQTTNLPAIGDIYSISWWMYQPGGGVSKMPWGYSNGNHLNFYDRYCNTLDGSNNPYYIPGTTTVITSPQGNMWHHMVQVGDGSTVKIYMDGVLYGQAKTFRGITGTTLILNGYNTSTNYKLANAKLSDLRIYATALSAEDVRQLYQVGASIDNMGNVHSYEIDETSTTKTKLSKTGIFETGELIEGNDKAIIEKDVDMNINEFIET